MSPTEIAARSSEVAILGRLFVNGQAELTPERARFLLELGFSEEDQARMAELTVLNQAGNLTDEEHDELLGFAKAGCLLGILQSRARRVLRKPTGRRKSG